MPHTRPVPESCQRISAAPEEAGARPASRAHVGVGIRARGHVQLHRTDAGDAGLRDLAGRAVLQEDGKMAGVPRAGRCAVKSAAPETGQIGRGEIERRAEGKDVAGDEVRAGIVLDRHLHPLRHGQEPAVARRRLAGGLVGADRLADPWAWSLLKIW